MKSLVKNIIQVIHYLLIFLF